MLVWIRSINPQRSSWMSFAKVDFAGGDDRRKSNVGLMNEGLPRVAGNEYLWVNRERERDRRGVQMCVSFVCVTFRELASLFAEVIALKYSRLWNTVTSLIRLDGTYIYELTSS